jgi:hypothetical protein
MPFNVYERKLTDEFFNSEIGRVVKDAIYNDMTIMCEDVGIITGGEYTSNDITIVYESDNHEPIMRTGNVSYRDTLLVENLEENIRTVQIHTAHSTSNGKHIVYAINGVTGGGPFYLIWTTTIFVNNEPVNTYSKRIKVIPKAIHEVLSEEE